MWVWGNLFEKHLSCSSFFFSLSLFINKVTLLSPPRKKSLSSSRLIDPQPPSLLPPPTNTFLKLPPPWALVTALPGSSPVSARAHHLRPPPLPRGSLKLSPTFLHIHSHPRTEILPNKGFNCYFHWMKLPPPNQLLLPPSPLRRVSWALVVGEHCSLQRSNSSINSCGLIDILLFQD